MFGSIIRSVTRRAAGFTLVELLVVIGIIALLISILLPVLNKARESANRAACMSNQKQIILAMLMYANEHRQSLPGPCVSCINNPAIVNSSSPGNPAVRSVMDYWNTSSAGPGFYASRELSHMNLLQRYLAGNGYAGIPATSAQASAMSGYEAAAGNTKTVWRCPSASAMWESATAVSTSTYFPNKALGYGYVVNNTNQLANTNPTYLFGDYTSMPATPTAQDVIDRNPKRIPQIQFVVKDPAGNTTARTSDATKIWILSDLDGRNLSTSVNSGMAFVTGLSTDGLSIKNARPFQPVHRNGLSLPFGLGRNYGYLDGHVEWVPYGEWPASTNASVN